MINPKKFVLVTTVFSDPLTQFSFLEAVREVGLSGMYVDGDVYLRKIDFEKIYKRVRKNPILIISKELKIHKFQFKNLLNIAKKLNKIKFQFLSTKDLISKFNLFFDSFKRVSTIIDHPFFFEYSIVKILKEKLKGITDEEMAAFFSPSKKLMTEEEKIKILNFALEISKNRKFKKLFLKNDIKEILKNHYLAEKIKSLKEKYSFLGKMFFSGEPFSLEYYFDQISDCLKMGEKDIKTKLKETKEARKQNTKKKKEIIRKYNVKDKKILGLIKLASEISFYRNWRLEIANKSIFFVLPLLNEIAKRLKITYQDLIQLTPKEIICCLKEGMISKKFKNLIASRKKGFAVIEVKNKVKILTGKDLEKIKNKLKISYEKTKLIKGISANPGNITGKCVIINSPKDFKKVEKGSIIVTKMTTTEFVPVLKKSKGLITDIGGLTSHAAIVSRELNIPCIIGTKIATKVLKDGNLVEVDAEKGVVKILKS